MKKIFKIWFLFVAIGFSAQASAIGTTLCSNAEGTIKRVEQEIWGANPVHWSIYGEEFSQQDVTIDKDTVKILSTEVTFDSPLGEKRVETSVMKVMFPQEGGSESGSDFVICKSVEYPNAID